MDIIAGLITNINMFGTETLTKGAISYTQTRNALMSFCSCFASDWPVAFCLIWLRLAPQFPFELEFLALDSSLRKSATWPSKASPRAFREAVEDTVPPAETRVPALVTSAPWGDRKGQLNYNFGADIVNVWKLKLQPIAQDTCALVLLVDLVDLETLVIGKLSGGTRHILEHYINR